MPDPSLMPRNIDNRTPVREEPRRVDTSSLAGIEAASAPPSTEQTLRTQPTIVSNAIAPPPVIQDTNPTSPTSTNRPPSELSRIVSEPTTAERITTNQTTSEIVLENSQATSPSLVINPADTQRAGPISAAADTNSTSTFGSASWAAALPNDDIQQRIDNWSGTDNDPILDRLVTERNSRLPEPGNGWESFGDYQNAVENFANGVDSPGTVSYRDPHETARSNRNAESNNPVSYRNPNETARSNNVTEEEFSVLLHEANEADNKINNWNGTDNDPMFDQLVRDRNNALEQIAGDDEELGAIMLDLINDGVATPDAIGEAVNVHYADASMDDLLNELQTRTAPGSDFDPFAFGINANLANRVESFTGADAGTVNVGIAGWAESQGMTYNEAAAAFNAQASSDGSDTSNPITYVDAPIASGDEIANRLVANPALFTELETALQRDEGSYDGKLSMRDIDSILANPEGISAEARDIAQYFKDNPNEWATFDTARSTSALTGLTEGELGVVEGDSITSFADVQQRATNGQLFNTLSQAQELDVLIDSDGDGIYNAEEFEAALDRLDSVDPELRESIDVAINYALDQGMDGEVDSRAWHTKLRDGAWEISSLGAPPLTAWRVATDPSGLADDYLSVGRGSVDAVVGIGQMAYDVSAITPYSPVNLIETMRVDGDMSQHRGVKMADGLVHMAEAVSTLDPTNPAFWEAREEVRRSGTWDSHDGLNLIESTADWETFVDDPSRWVGQFAPDVVIGVLTGGTGAAVTRTGSTAARAANAGRRAMTQLMENGAEQSMRNLMRHGADIDLPPPSAADARWLDADLGAPRIEDTIRLDSDLPPPGRADVGDDVPHIFNNDPIQPDQVFAPGEVIDRQPRSVQAQPHQSHPLQQPPRELGPGTPRKPDDVSATEFRNTPGHVTGLSELQSIPADQLLRGTDRVAGWIPREIGEAVVDTVYSSRRAKVDGVQQYRNFDELRKDIWKSFADQPDYARQFPEVGELRLSDSELHSILRDEKTNVLTEAGFDPAASYTRAELDNFQQNYGPSLDPIERMSNGKAPIALHEQRRRSAGLKYEIHHMEEINAGGGVYDLSNLVITSPLKHTHDLHNKTMGGIN